MRAWTQIEHLFTSVLEECAKGGAGNDHIVHMFLEAHGMDYRFVFNHSGPKAVTVNDLLHKGIMNKLVDEFASLIQSGKEVSLDNKTSLEVYTYNVPSGGGKRVRMGFEDSFTEGCRGIRRVINPDETCVW